MDIRVGAHWAVETWISVRVLLFPAKGIKEDEVASPAAVGM